jgi:hypothetical protein
MAPSTTRVPATATFNRVSGAMWLTYADGRTVNLSPNVTGHQAAGAVLAALGAVRLSDWGLVADRAPMRQARIEVAPDLSSRY